MRRRVYNKDYFGGYSYVDLGLPSGLLWATKDVGAKSEMDFGNYYAFGAITPYDKNDKWKGCWFGTSGTLPYSHDVASQVMGGNWRTPTKDEYSELIFNNTNYTIFSENGVTYLKLTSKKYPDRYLIFAGSGYWDETYFRKDYVLRWTSTPSANSHYASRWMAVHYFNDDSRSYGIPVRGVITPPQVINMILILIKEGGEV